MPFRVAARFCTFGPLLAAIALLPLAICAAPASAPAPTVAISPNRLIQLLSQTIALDRQAALEEQAATTPQEQMLLYDNRRIADQALGLAFDFARAQLAVMAAQPAQAAASTTGAVMPQYAALQRMLAKLDKDLKDTQAESNSDQQRLARATGARRVLLQSQISELQGEIALARARRDAVRSMLEYASGSAANEMSVSGLKAQIDALAASVPAEAAGSASSRGTNRAASPFAPAQLKPAPSGMWGLASDLFGLSSRIHAVNSAVAQTDALLSISQDLRAPYISHLRAMSKQGDELAAQADTAKPAQLAQEKQQLDALAAQFKQIVAAMTPLSRQYVLLNLYRKNLAAWRDSINARYASDSRSLGIRLGLLALLFAVLFGLSEVWRRAVYRYVSDTRRRHQFLLIRRFTLWLVVALVIAGTLAGKLSSFLTFAGLLTAGLALALQSVILSAVGYFFLIGKYGIRVGDRVEVSGAVGEVIDIGLVRFHLMELGAGSTPTGRVVAFSNSVVFQPAAGLFKQIPGASFSWHQLALTLPRDADFAGIRKSLLGAVENALLEFRPDIERVFREMEKRGILFSERGLQPKLELRLTPDGIEAIVRYPVDLHHATEIDSRVSRELQAVLERDFKNQSAATPDIRLKTDASGTPAG